jgi:hypothetical protein
VNEQTALATEVKTWEDVSNVLSLRDAKSKCLQVGRDLNDPKRLNKYDSRDVEDTAPSRQERFVLDPGDDVMK